jgi:hypothetical protein
MQNNWKLSPIIARNDSILPAYHIQMLQCSVHYCYNIDIKRYAITVTSQNVVGNDVFNYRAL